MKNPAPIPRGLEVSLATAVFVFTLAIYLSQTRPERRGEPERPPVESAAAVEVSPANPESPLSRKVMGEWSFSPTAIPDFQDWKDRYLAEVADARLVLVSDGIELAKARRAALKHLITTNPEAALREALTYEERRQLPESILRLLESPIHDGGSYEVATTCFDQDYPGGRMTRTATIDGRDFDVHTFGIRRDTMTKDTLSFHGIAVDEAMALDDDPVRVLSEVEKSDREIVEEGLIVEVRGRPYRVEGEGALDGLRRIIRDGELKPGHGMGAGYAALDDGRVPGVAAFGGPGLDDDDGGPVLNSTHTEGAKTILYIRVRFSDDAPAYEPVSLADAQARQAIVADFWESASYGKTTLTTTFTTVLDLPQNYNFYRNNGGALRTDARDAAIAANPAWDYNNFDFYTYVSRGGFPYSGVAAVGGKWSHLTPGGSQPGVAAHEFGHNLGLGHSNYWNSDSPSPIGRDSIPGGNVGDSPDDERITYGHIFDCMGNAGSDDSRNGRSHYAASNKEHIDWLVEADGDITTVTTGSATPIRLYRHDLNVPDLATYTPNVTRGIKIDVETSDYVTPGANSRRYWLNYRLLPELGDAEEWLPHGVQVDWSRNANAMQLDMTPYSRVFNTGDTNEKRDGLVFLGRTYSDEGADIHVTPVATGGSSPDEWIDVVVQVGTQAANNPPTATLTPNVTNMNLGDTTNFTVTGMDVDGDTLAYSWDLGDGVNDSTTFNVTSVSKDWDLVGTFVVKATVSDMKGGVAVATQTVQVGPPVPGRATISGRVVQGGLPVTNALIKLDGTAAAWTASDGTYTLPSLAAGSYDVEASKEGRVFSKFFSPPVVLGGLDAGGIDFFANGVFLGSGSSEIIITPYEATVPLGASFHFNDETWDATGNRIGSPSLSWSVTGGGTIDSFGLFNALNPGTWSVTASGGGLSATATVTVIDDLIVAAAAPDPSAKENTPDTGMFRINRYGTSTGAVTVNFTLSGTATEGADYSTIGTSAVIPNGASFVDIPLNPLDDFAVESLEIATLTITPDSAYSVFSDESSASIKVADDGVDVGPTIQIDSPADPEVTVILGNGLLIEVSASDDGLPGPVTGAWSVEGAPDGGTVSFSHPASLSSAAFFSLPGLYTLRVTASDGANAATADLDVFVTSFPYANPSTADQVIHYPFDEGSGTDAGDAVGADHNGTLENGAGWSAAGGGIFGTALVLDGVNDQVNISNSSDINSSAQEFRTIALWFKAVDPSKSAKQVLYEEGGAGKGLNIYLHNNTLYVGGWNDGSNGWDSTFLSTPLSDSAWHHVALVMNAGDNNTLQPDTFFGYLDGIEFARGDSSKLGSHTGNIAIGARRNATEYHDGDSSGTGDRFEGAIDEFHLWNRALAAGEVRQLSSAGSMPAGLTFGGSTSISGALVIPSGVGLVLDGGVVGSGITDTTWIEYSAPAGGSTTLGDPDNTSTTATFSGPGFYVLQLMSGPGSGNAALRVPVHVGIDAAVNPPTTNQVIYYNLDETSGTTAIDGVGADNNGTLAGSPAWSTTSISGGALHFDGLDDQVNIADSPDINSGTHGQRTIAFWFAADDPNASGKQTLYQEGGTTRGLNLYIEGGLLYVGGWNNGERGWDETYLAVSVNDTEWHHVALTLDAPGASSLIPDAFIGYLDGFEFARGSASQVNNHTGNISMGAKRDGTRYHDGNSGGGGDYFRGYIDEFHLFNDRTLTIDEIGGLYAYGNIGPSVDADVNPPVISGLEATLDATRADDGKGGGSLTTEWIVPSAPAGGSLVFSNPDASGIESTATGNLPGDFTLQLRAADGAVTTFDEISISLIEDAAGQYAGWMTGFPSIPPAEQGYTFQPFGGGMTNLELYALGGDPTAPASAAAVAPTSAVVEDAGDTWFEFQYRRRRDALARGLTYTPAFSSDLTTGNWDTTAYTEQDVDILDADFELVTVRYDNALGPAHAACYGRVEITIAD